MSGPVNSTKWDAWAFINGPGRALPMEERVKVMMRCLQDETLPCTPDSPWVAATWLGYRLAMRETPVTAVKLALVLDARGMESRELEGRVRNRWECSLQMVRVWLSVLGGVLEVAPVVRPTEAQRMSWVQSWPPTVVNVMRLEALEALERERAGKLAVEGLEAWRRTLYLWRLAVWGMGMPECPDAPYGILEHDQALDAMAVQVEALARVGVMKFDRHQKLLTRLERCWKPEVEVHVRAWKLVRGV